MVGWLEFIGGCLFSGYSSGTVWCVVAVFGFALGKSCDRGAFEERIILHSYMAAVEVVNIIGWELENILATSLIELLESCFVPP